MLKVALLNNMNNNFFTLARYLRDQGIDAHIFQIDALDKHFRPECDTFDDLNQCNYIHNVTEITFREFFKLPIAFKTKKKLNQLKKTLANFDIVVACGSLAILEKFKIHYDIFVPYGGDLYQAPFMFEYCQKKHFPYSWLMNTYIKYQRRGIARARAIIAYASLDGHFYDALTRLNEKWIDWSIPTVYPVPDISSGKWNYLDNHDFVLFSHSRQCWKTAMDYKGNDKAIRAFARFIKNQTKFERPVLVLFEYGPDVQASKELINELGIGESVVWMPTMERKYIYEGIKRASIVFDFFHDEVVTFGGVTFEAFCHAKPVMGNTKLKNSTRQYDIPLVQAYSSDDIYEVLVDYSINPDKYVQQGHLSKQWFDEHAGTGLMRKYQDLIEYLAKNKDISLKHESFDLPQYRNEIGPEYII